MKWQHDRRQVAWIHRALLHTRTTALRDLGCGPGLYTSRLARLGDTCMGIDFSPAAIAYVRTAAEQQLARCYELEDLRIAAFSSRFGLAMCVYGELNIFPRVALISYV